VKLTYVLSNFPLIAQRDEVITTRFTLFTEAALIMAFVPKAAVRTISFLAAASAALCNYGEAV